MFISALGGAFAGWILIFLSWCMIIVSEMFLKKLFRGSVNDTQVTWIYLGDGFRVRVEAREIVNVELLAPKGLTLET